MLTPLRLIITMGEPAGIGPDIIIQIAQHPMQHELVVIGDRAVLATRAQLLGLPLTLTPYQMAAARQANAQHEIKLIHLPVAEPDCLSQLKTSNVNAVLQSLQLATQRVQQNEFAALITGPVHKGIINSAGQPFSGQTEFIAQLIDKTLHPVMSFVAPGGKVALATTHLPLREVASHITIEQLVKTISVLHQDCIAKFAIDEPVIHVCGLNPHAGENGFLGTEEIFVIKPAIAECKARGINAIGPLPADTAFVPEIMAKAHVTLAMYHDQGLPVIKQMGFSKAVNVTLGIPIIRTSVDHGVALDLAGTGRSDPNSLRHAIHIAAQMVAQSHRGHDCEIT